MLTLEGFLERLRKTPRNWELCGSALRMDIANPHGYLASRTWAACPITSLAKGGALSANRWRFIAEELGLPWPLASQIMQAADGVKYRDKLRKQLLAACGLKDEPC